MTNDYTLLRETLRPGKYGYIADFLSFLVAMNVLHLHADKSPSLYRSLSRRRTTLRYLSTVSLLKIDEHLTW